MFKSSKRRQYIDLIEQMADKLVSFHRNVGWRMQEQCSHGHFDPPTMFKMMASERYDLHLLAERLRLASGCTRHDWWVRDMIDHQPEVITKNIGHQEWLEPTDGETKQMGPFPALTGIDDLAKLTNLGAYFPPVERFDEYVLKDSLLNHGVNSLGISLIDLCELRWRSRGGCI